MPRLLSVSALPLSLLLSLSVALSACTGEEAPEQAAVQGDEKVPGLQDALNKAPESIPAPDDVAAAPKDAEVTESGLASKVLTAGTGTDTPAAADSVEVHYTGWTTDGEMFDSSVTRGKPTSFPLNRVIAGWTEGMQLMVVGEKRRFWIPEELAYKGRPGAPAGMLVFDVELLEITKAPEPPPVPEDVAAPPADAQKSASGLAWQVLKDGEGGDTPSKFDKVQVNYTGWTTDGEMFDSSITRGRPATFNVNQVIPGWTEGLQLMTKGEKRIFWIPVEQAYNNMPGKPAGMLVFEVELLNITKLPPPPTPPADVASIPKDAEVTSTGLASRQLKAGTGAVKPGATDKVTVHYSGWTTDGDMFDSSITRGRPATFPLNRVIAGWTEGLQLMVEGEKRLFWIPEELAYKGMPGKPAGMLVFEVELVSIGK